MQYQKHSRAKKIIKTIDNNPSNYLVIHYSCESFYEIKDGHTPRITSIAIYYYDSGQTDSFSIHKTAEKNHINNIEDNYDSLERKMLDDFFNYAKEHNNYSWIHWNMRDINYGFKAIEHRYEVLGGNPYIINDYKKIDLARLFIDLYGKNYVDHPRMTNILKMNIKLKDFLSGKEEAEAFTNKEYIKLHQSTLRKVNVFSDLLNLAVQGKLKTNAKWYEQYGLSFQGIYEYCSSTWWIQLIWSIFMLFLGAFIGKIF